MIDLPNLEDASQVDIERELIELSNAAEECHRQLRRESIAAAKAEHAFKLAEAKAMTAARIAHMDDKPKAPVAVLEAEVYERVEKEHMARISAEALRDATKEQGRMIQSQMSALQTVLADMRALVSA